MTAPRLDAQMQTAQARHVSGGGGGEGDLRRVAAEFEALLLAQLTSALNPSGEDDDEGSAFGGGGMSLYRRMFSERIAQVMAESGGVGIGDLIVSRMRPQASDGAAANPVQTAIDASKLIRGRSHATAASVDVVKVEAAASSVQASNVQASSVQAATAAKMSSSHRASSVDATRDVYLVSEAGVEAVPSSSSRPRVVSAGGPPAVADATVNVGEGVKRAVESVGASGLAAEAGAPVVLRMPVEGRISSSFGLRRDPVHGGHKHHRGLDIAAPRGTPIEAAASGTVVFSGWRRGYGNTVTIEHADGRRTRYAHADELLVSRGDVVEAGQTIAKVGSTGRSTGPHLHFEVFEGDVRVDPLRALAKGLTLARR